MAMDIGIQSRDRSARGNRGPEMDERG